MEIIASAILGRSSFTFGLSRIIRFYLQVGALSIKQDLQTRPSSTPRSDGKKTLVQES